MLNIKTNMNKKLNKKLLNLIALCSGLTATVALGVGGVVYSLRQEKDGGDEPIDQKVLPESVYKFSEDGKTLLGFKDEFLNDPDSEIYKDNFQDCDTMQIPASVTSIADVAFHGPAISLVPDYIKKINFPVASKCSSIGEFSFAFCLADSIKLPNSLTSIGNQAFYYCWNISSMMFPSSLQTIGESAFSNCQKLTSVDFSNCLNLSSIGNYAYCMCSSLNSVSFSSSLTTIGVDAFLDCSNLSSITWDRWTGSFDSLASDAFSGVCQIRGDVIATNPSDDTHNSDALLDYLLKNGGLPSAWAKPDPLPEEEVYNIDENNVLLGFTDEFLANPTAYDMHNTMEIPARVTSVKYQAFYKNSTSTIPSFVTKLTFAENSNCSYIDHSAFRSCSSLVSVDISKANNLTTINQCAFKECSSLTSIDFSSDKLKNLHSYAFADCSKLISIKIPSTCNHIDSNSFNNCSNLNSITWDRWTGSFDFLASDAFSGVCPDTGTVKVTHPIDSEHGSAALLAHLKQYGGLPGSWQVAED